MRVELSYEQGAAVDLQTAIATRANKRMPARATAHDGDRATEVAVTRVPASGTYIAVSVNGLTVQVGNGQKAASCYFSGNGGVDARAWSEISQGDTLHWQGSIAGYQLAVGDEIDLFYEENS